MKEKLTHITDNEFYVVDSLTHSIPYISIQLVVANSYLKIKGLKALKFLTNLRYKSPGIRLHIF